MPEQVDILIPPLFQKSGVVKERTQAYKDGDWLGGFNLWIVQSRPIPAFIYQIRSQTATWEPGKLDVAAGGHFTAGETLWDGLREAKEELGKQYRSQDVTYLGRRLNISLDTKNVWRHSVVDIAIVEDNQELENFVLQESELSGLCLCPLADLKRVFTKPKYSFEVEVLLPSGETQPKTLTQDSFPKNWDNYQYKMTLLADKFINGERSLLY